MNELELRIAELESKNTELEQKLTDAYSINARESSLEAERLRHNLTESFKYIHEDWMEYKDSEVSENNYESLKAILKKVFRSLDRNGIKF